MPRRRCRGAPRTAHAGLADRRDLVGRGLIQHRQNLAAASRARRSGVLAHRRTLVLLMLAIWAWSVRFLKAQAARLRPDPAKANWAFDVGIRATNRLSI